MNRTQIDIINESSLTDTEVSAALPALQKQADEHFAAAYGYSADLHFVPKGHAATPGHEWIGIFDTSDQPGALGYHDLTPQGLPFGKVFQATSKQYSDDWRVTLSHELLEQLADPDINLTVFAQTSNTSGTLYAYEVCDAVESDTYMIDGVPVSNFVLPAYFEPSRKAGPFDYLGKLHACVPAMTRGGYLSEFRIGHINTGWRQINGELTKEHKVMPADHSRRARRGRMSTTE